MKISEKIHRKLCRLLEKLETCEQKDNIKYNAEMYLLLEEIYNEWEMIQRGE